MGETFTSIFNAVTNKAQVKQSDVHEITDADDMVFYHSIRLDLDLLIKNPKPQTIHFIMDYSKSLR